MAVQDEEKWVLAEGEEDGNYLLFRARQEIPAGVLKMEYPVLVSIFWPYDETLNEGMPDDELSEIQFSFEEAITPLNDPECSELMLVIIGGGQKEWHFYAKNEQAWLDRLNELLEHEPEFPIEIEIAQDPQWEMYGNVIAGITSAEQDPE